MFAILVLFSTLFTTGNAINCYTCSAHTEKECISNQVRTECKTTDICMTFQFNEDKGSSIVPSYEKGCSSSFENCQTFCESGLPNIVRDCEVLQCCNKDNCNEKIDKEKSNSKRSTYNSHSESIIYQKSVNLPILLSLMVFYGYQVIAERNE